MYTKNLQIVNKKIPLLAKIIFESVFLKKMGLVPIYINLKIYQNSTNKLILLFIRESFFSLIKYFNYKLLQYWLSFLNFVQILFVQNTLL